MKRVIFALSAALLSTAVFADLKPVVVKCTFSEGKDGIGKSAELQSPYGGGKIAKFKTANGGEVDVTVSLMPNEDDQNLLDMSLEIETTSNKALILVGATGLSSNNYNGASATIISDKNGKIEDSARLRCDFK
jgi:hypothetical protein